jgi:hypothetical protein
LFSVTGGSFSPANKAEISSFGFSSGIGSGFVSGFGSFKTAGCGDSSFFVS